MHSVVRVTLVVASTLSAMTAWAGAAKPAAEYWMSVATESMSVPGMADAAGGGLEGMLGSMAMGAMGMGGGPRRALLLDLLGPNTPPAPRAEHVIPAGLKMGNSLPLVTPARGGTPDTDADARPEDVRILVYWGCGDAVRRGQPRVLDSAKMSPDDYASVLVARGGASRFRLSPRPGWTYGEWPHREAAREVPADGSLQGAHLIKGNYAPDIRFNIDARHDFMDPVVFTKVEGELTDPIRLEWRSVPGSLGYFMMATGGSETGGEVVIWTSSEVQEMGGGLMSYLPNTTVQKYVREQVILGPGVTRCTVPKGIFGRTEGAALQFVAYGEELNFAEPPKPKDPKAKWNPIWTAKVRAKSTAMLPLGMEGGEATGTSASSGHGGRGQEKQNPVNDAVEGVKQLKGLFGF